MMRLEDAINGMRDEIVGEKFTFSELDEKMMEAGFYSNMDAGLDWFEVAESGVVYYLFGSREPGEACNYARIEFQADLAHIFPDDDEYTISIRVTNIEED